ncbi:MAG: tyrosine-type recombinase/integrase [Cytophagaceae bacterium]|nr:tyrosine-type recombinase/integrase [Cytophagaceae bacterium]
MHNLDTRALKAGKIHSLSTTGSHADDDQTYRPQPYKSGWHIGRHTFATMFLRKNGKVQVLQRLLGHGDIQTTMRYVHLVEGEIDEQMQLMNDF